MQPEMSIQKSGLTPPTKHLDSSNMQAVFAASKDTMIFNAMQDSGIPVERKNSAASTASSSRKGSNDRTMGDDNG